MVRFEIFNATQVWRGCEDMRPWLIIEMRQGSKVACFPFSGECYGSDCFPVSATHPDFPATGLAKSCYIIDTHIVEIPLTAFGRRRGELTNKLLTEFREYAGI